MLTVEFFVMVTGCVALRPIATEEELNEISRIDANYQFSEHLYVTKRLVARMFKEHDDFASGRSNQPPVLDVLALSGGGDYGAFGAGFLNGWGEAEPTSVRRPEFDAITGVSTGALLAPFAFLGTEHDLARVEQFYRNPKHDWVRLRGLLFFLPQKTSLLKIIGLEREIRRAINEDFVQRMALESESGRIVLISATNLEFGRQRVWELGNEAKTAVANGQIHKVQDMLLASSAIPGAFPPREILGLLYSDGGITANILVPLEKNDPNSFIETWKREHPDVPLPRVRYWVIVNGQLNQPPSTAQPKWAEIASVGIAASIRAGNIAQIELLASRADFLNATEGMQIEVWVVAIPDDWRAPVEGKFKKETMNSLVDMGIRMGRAPESWKCYTDPLAR